MQIDVAYIWAIEIFFNNIIDIIIRDFFLFAMITKKRPWRHIYHDIRIPRLKNHNIEIPGPKNRDIEVRGLKQYNIEKRRQIGHDIVIPRRFFRGQKAATSRFHDQKATTSITCGILTLMPPDSYGC